MKLWFVILGFATGFGLWFALTFLPGPVGGSNTLLTLILLLAFGFGMAGYGFFTRAYSLALLGLGLAVGILVALPIAPQFIGVIP